MMAVTVPVRWQPPNVRFRAEEEERDSDDESLRRWKWKR